MNRTIIGFPDQDETTMINELAAEIHQDNVDAGWWDMGVENRNKGELIALMHSELSECLEGVRKECPDDKLPHRSMEEVELADTMIRILDYAGAFGLDLDGAIREKRAFNKVRCDHQREHRNAAGGKKF